MKKVLLILFAVLLLLPIRLVSQEEVYRVITKKELDTFYGKQRYDGKRKVYVTESNGKTTSIKTNNILSIRKEIKGWKYFEWEKTAFTDYLEVNIDSMSKEELFARAKEWIEISFLPTEKGFLIQPDSIFSEYQGRKSYRNQYFPNGVVRVRENLPSMLPDVEYKFNIDEDNFKITLVSLNQNVLTSLVIEASTIYTINLSFFDGGYKMDPVQLFYFFIVPKDEDQDKNLIDIVNPFDVIIDSAWDHLTGNYERKYIVEIPLSDIRKYRDKSGKLSRNLRCTFNRFEVLFNDLNRTLFNYINGDKLEPNIYVYYPEVSCYMYWRTW